MVRKSNEAIIKLNEKMRGGNGIVKVSECVIKGDYKGNARLIGVLTLAPGCSIGEHIHENEEEIFYIINGTATYNDNGETVTLEEGDSCVCVGGQKHSIANDSDEVLKVFAVILTY